MGNEELEATEAAAEKEAVEDAAIEKVAIEMGYNPDFDGEGKKTAREYILNGQDIQKTMRTHMKTLKQNAEEIQKGAAALALHTQKSAATRVKAVEKELAELKAERREAITDGDLDKVDALDETIDQKKEDVRVVADEPVPEAYASWIEKNEWYTTDDELHEYADAQAKLPKYDGMSQKRILVGIEKSVKKNFPDKFETKQKSSSSPRNTVEDGGHTTSKSSKKLKKSDLDEYEVEAMKAAIQHRVFKNEAAWLEQQSKVRG